MKPAQLNNIFLNGLCIAAVTPGVVRNLRNARDDSNLIARHFGCKKKLIEKMKDIFNLVEKIFFEQNDDSDNNKNIKKVFITIHICLDMFTAAEKDYMTCF